MSHDGPTQLPLADEPPYLKYFVDFQSDLQYQIPTKNDTLYSNSALETEEYLDQAIGHRFLLDIS